MASFLIHSGAQRKQANSGHAKPHSQNRSILRICEREVMGQWQKYKYGRKQWRTRKPAEPAGECTPQDNSCGRQYQQSGCHMTGRVPPAYGPLFLLSVRNPVIRQICEPGDINALDRAPNRLPGMVALYSVARPSASLQYRISPGAVYCSNSLLSIAGWGAL